MPSLSTERGFLLTVYTKLKSLLAKFKISSLDRRETVELISITRTLYQSHLLQYRSSVLRLCENAGMSTDDVAIDCIVKIFSGREEQYQPLRDFISSLSASPADISESDLFLQYRGFVITLADRELADLYAKNDPEGNKILRNIREYIKKKPIFELRRDFRSYVLLAAGAEMFEHLPRFPDDLLAQRFLELAGGNNFVPELVQHLHALLISQSEYRRSVPLMDAVLLFKTFYAAQEKEELPDVNAVFTMENLDLETMVAETVEAVNEKILISYLRKKKITVDEARRLSYTMSSIIHEWFTEKKEQDSFFQHAKMFFDLSEEQYGRRWRTTIEYLAKIAKQKLRTDFSEEL